MPSSRSDWDGLPLQLLQVQLRSLRSKHIHNSANDHVCSPQPLEDNYWIAPCRGSASQCDAIVSLCVQSIAACLDREGHRRRMQLTCRAWAAAASPTRLHLPILSSKNDATLDGMLHIRTAVA